MIAVGDNRVLQTASHISVHTPWFVEFVEDWRKAELDKLPYAKDNLPIQQGRVQILDELLRLLINAPADIRRAQETVDRRQTVA